MSELLLARVIAPSVTVDGVPLPGLERLEIHHHGSFEAARFEIEVAMAAAPGGAGWFAGLQGGLVQVNLGSDLPGLGSVGPGRTLIVGQVDNVVILFGQGSAILHGRDLAARLIDAEVDATLSNMTASQIAQEYAAAAGLAANVTATKTRVGQYYELAHAQTGLGLHSRHATRWDLLAALADLEQFALSVTGTTLNFAPPTQAAPMLLTWGQDLRRLAFDRALSLASPKVTVKSWNPRLKRMFEYSVGQTGGTTLIRPNLTQNEVERLAISRQAALAAQAVLVRASMPGETTLAPGSPIQIQGTGTILDTTYVVRSISRIVDGRIGFLQHFEAMQAT